MESNLDNKVISIIRKKIGEKRNKFSILLLLFIFPFLILLTSLFLIKLNLYYSAVLVWLFIPISYLFLIGSIKSRLLNVIPMIVYVLYISITLETKDVEKASFLFFILPISSILFKPKKHLIQYASLILSIIYLIITHLDNITFPYGVKLILILVLNIVFVPPLIKKKLSNFSFIKEKKNQDQK